MKRRTTKPVQIVRSKTVDVSETNICESAQLVNALREYQALEKKIGAVDASRFAAKYPDIADELQDCIEGLKVMQGVSDLAAPPLSYQPPETLGGFRIRKRIGGGGMGTVYEAEEIATRKSVALKVLNPNIAVDERRLKRFQLEAQIAAMLDHPNIVPVVTVGTDNGMHYYVMPYIQGCNLEVAIQCIRIQSNNPDDSVNSPSQTKANSDPLLVRCEAGNSNQATFDLIARLFAQAADALDYAHEQGVIHRDIKPSNLIIDPDGKLWVTDFGLARLPDEANITLSNDMPGTPRYMSPQQLQGKRELVDRRTDIYSLGATLYEVLTLAPAISGDTPSMIQDAILNRQPTPVSRLRPDIPIALARIVDKAMAKNVNDRYQAARALADDLSRFVKGEPVLARSPRLVLRIRRRCEKHLVTILTTCAALLVLLTLVTVAALLLRHESIAKAEAFALANTQKKLAENRELEVRQAERLAEYNLKQAVHAIDNYYSLITSDEALQRRDLQELKMKLLSSALPFLKKLKDRQVGQSIDINETTAYARYRLGAILMEIQEFEAAAEELKHAGDLFGQLRKENPEDHYFAVNQVSSYISAALGLTEIGQHLDAEKCYKAAWRYQENYIESFPAAAMVAGMLRGDLKFGLSSLYFYSGDFARAERECREAIEMTAGFFAHYQDCEKQAELSLGDRRPFLAEYRAMLGLILNETGRHDEAVESLERAVQDLGQPETPRTKLKLVGIQIHFASVLLNDEPTRSLALCNQAIAVQEEIFSRNDVSIGNPDDLIAAYSIASLALTSLDRRTEANDLLAKVDPIRKQSSPSRRRDRAIDLFERAQHALHGE